jgi:type IV secretion system protein VirD4
VFDPFLAAGMPAIRWSPLIGAGTWPEALDMAYWLTQAASVSHNVQNAEFWETLARTLLAPLLYAAANDPAGTMGDVLSWSNQPELAHEVFAVLEDIQAHNPTDPGPRLAHSALSACISAEARRRDSIYGTAQVLLDVYRYPAVAGMAAGCDIDREEFLQGFDDHGAPLDNTVFVYSPEHRQDQLRPLIEAFVSRLIRGLEDRYALTGLALDPPLLLMLDEAGNIAPLRQLGTYASSLASQGCQLVSVFQNLSQIRDRYGSQATTIVTNHLAKVLMAGTTDVELLNLLSHLLGKQDATEETLTYGPDGSRSSSTSIRQHELAPIHTLVQQRPGQVLALLSHRKPVRLHVRPYTEAADLRAFLPRVEERPR